MTFRKIFGWNLRNCENINPYGDGLFRELTDDAILAIDYNGHNGTFAFSTANNHIFIHKWSSNYREIKLLQTLKVSLNKTLFGNVALELKVTPSDGNISVN